MLFIIFKGVKKYIQMSFFGEVSFQQANDWISKWDGKKIKKMKRKLSHTGSQKLPCGKTKNQSAKKCELDGLCFNTTGLIRYITEIASPLGLSRREKIRWNVTHLKLEQLFNNKERFCDRVDKWISLTKNREFSDYDEKVEEIVEEIRTDNNVIFRHIRPSR